MLPYTTWWKSSYLFSYSRFDQIKGKQRSSTCILPKPASTSANQGNILGSTSIIEPNFSCSPPGKITNMYIIFNPDFPTSRILKLSSIKKREKKLLKIRGWRQRIFKNFEITRTIYSNSERPEQFLVTECFFNLFPEVSHIW